MAKWDMDDLSKVTMNLWRDEYRRQWSETFGIDFTGMTNEQVDQAAHEIAVFRGFYDDED